MTEKNEIANEDGKQARNKIRRVIGTTTYDIYINFSTTSKENMSDKILRFIKNDISNGNQK